MDSHVTVNVVEPGSSIPVPNTGAMTMGGLSVYETAAIGVGAFILVLTLAVIIATAINKKKQHKVFDMKKGFRVGMKKRTIFGMVVLLALCGAFGYGAMKLDEQKEDVFADGLKNQQIVSIYDNTIGVSASDITMNIELEDDGAFAYVGDDVKVTAPTYGGYQLYMYAGQPDLVNKKTGDKIESISAFDITAVEPIPKDAAYESEEDAIFAAMFSKKLSENTWGYAIEKPKGADSAIWNGIANEDANFYSYIKYTEDATEANDTTKVYFGVSLAPEFPYGTYETTITYVALANFIEPDITFIYSGEDIYFDEAKTQTINAVGFSVICDNELLPPLIDGRGALPSGCEWTKVAGKYKEPILDEAQKLEGDGWYSDDFDYWFPEGEEEIIEALNDWVGNEYYGSTIELLGAVTDYFTITYDANGGSFTKVCGGLITSVEGPIDGKKGGTREVECQEETVTSVSIQYSLGDSPRAYLEGYMYNNGDLYMLGWSEDKNATLPIYEDWYDRIPVSPLMKGMNITLYSIWRDTPIEHSM